MQKTLKEEIDNYEPPQLRTVAELNSISIDMEVKFEKDVKYPYKYIEVEGERYKIPNSVIASLNEILKENPNLKSFKVKKTGEGIKTKYTVIPLQ